MLTLTVDESFVLHPGFIKIMSIPTIPCLSFDPSQMKPYHFRCRACFYSLTVNVKTGQDYMSMVKLNGLHFRGVQYQVKSSLLTLWA